MKRILLALLPVLLLCGQAFSSCASPKNKIEAENCLVGNDSSQWSVGGSGDPSIQGFATDISVNAGGTINFKISTTASAYTINIFRLGYYGGLGARKIASITPSVTLPQTQPACNTDPATNLYDCGNWAVSASWQVPATALAGVYFAVLTRTDTGGASQIVFVVRNDSSTSDVVFQTADESWQAYNPYGGHSLYGGNATFDLTNRAYKVSYNRPFATLNLEDQTWIIYAEYPMIRWLEMNGYDVTYISSIDSARTGSLIKQHKLFLSVGHDEYVSAPKRNNIEAARDAGVNLAFFSGNEFFWKTRWENSVDGTNTPFRTLVCYKETLSPNSVPTATQAFDPLDPPFWTGTWRDPAKSPPSDGGRPENSLTGTLFKVNGPGADNTNLSIKVPAADGKMRFWRNTKVAAQTAGQTWTLPASTLGYEWDVDADNGSRPAGLFDLSTATYSLTTDYLQDSGGIYGTGTATHRMTMYRAPSGALVFGAGTVQWSWGLDAFSGGTADANMQQATVNMFADMGVQPATLQAGLSPAAQSTDFTPPRSQITSPAPGVALTVGTAVTFTGTSADAGGGVIGGVEISVDSGKTWHPATGRESWSYTWTPTVSGSYTAMTRASDDSGNIETPSDTINFISKTSTQTLTSVTLSSNTASNGATVQGTVQLGQPAAAGGVVVTLASTNSTVASVPPSVTVPAGQFTANFTVTTASQSSPLPIAVTISGTFVATLNASLMVEPILPPAPGSIAIDTLVTKDQTASTGISAVFSTSLPNELLLALVSTDSNSSGHVTVTGVTGDGLTWELVQRTNTQLGTSEIWRTFATNQVVNAAVTVTLSQQVGASLTVMSFAGVDTSGTNGSGAIGATGTGNAASGAPTASLTTTRANSLVLGVGNDWDQALARGLGPNQSMIHQSVAANGDTYWMQMQSSPIAAIGTHVTINDVSPTTDRYNLSIAEVLVAAAGTEGISGSVTPASVGSGTILTLSGAANATSAADTSGNYAFVELADGTYSVTPSNPSNPGVVFTPSSQTVVLNNGSATGVNFNASVLSSITVTPSNPTIGGGATQQFTATGNYSDGTTQNLTNLVTWTSSNTAVATINSAGLLTAVAGGTATIKAVQGSLSGSTALTVKATQLIIGTSSLPNGTQNEPYSATLSASGGTAPFTWSLVTGTTLPAGLTLSTTGQITGMPTALGTATFTVKVTDGASPAQVATQQLSITIITPPPPTTIWPASTVPTLTDAGADQPVELGVKFHSDNNGFITGIRFYKASTNTGTHVGNLWNSGGTLLATATFSNETASGWQQVNFSSPIAIAANTVYVASYHTTIGHYSDDRNYFSTTGADNPPLHALKDGTSGPDGVFAYGSTSVFPSNGVNGSNYWVDIAFVPAVTLQTITVTPANLTIATGATQQFTATGTYGDGSTQNITGQVTWSSSNLVVATINATGLASGAAGGTTVISATQSGVSGSTTLTVPATPLSITTTSLSNATQNQPYSATVKASGGTAPYTWSLVTGSTLPAGLTLSSTGQISGNPTVLGTTSFTIMVSDGGSPIQTATQTLSMTIVPPPPAFTIWPITAVPSLADAGADTPVELGVAFKSDQNGFITGVRFYKSANNTGTHIGNLWSASGSNLATATFTNETASGWQQVNFSSPIAITANTVYVASYHSTIGHYSDDKGYFSAAGVDNAPLHALKNGTSGYDGVYAYGSTSTFPNNGFNASNYWVDVAFVPAAALQTISVTPSNPTIAAGANQQFTATGTYTDGSTQNLTNQVTWSSSNTAVATITSGLATGVAGGNAIITAAESGLSGSTTLAVAATQLAIATASLSNGALNQSYSATLSGVGGTAPYTWSLANGTTLPSGLTLSNGQISGIPLVAGTFTFTVQLTDGGSPTQSVSKQLSIAIITTPTPTSIWPLTATPTLTDAGADSPLELGVAFKSDVNGKIAGVRFYKSANNTGPHIGNLWTAGGVNLATATFTNETASGWQQVNFSSPVTIAAGTVYVASYHTTVGHYSDDLNFFTNAGVDNAPLHALKDGVAGPDGLFAYGPGSFPSSGYAGSNYWVDVVFVPTGSPVSIAITPANPSITHGFTQAFAATATYADGSTQDITSQVTWSSSNTAVATITAAGVATGVGSGSTTITGTLGGVFGTTILSVQ